ASFGIRPKTRIAVARPLVLSLAHAVLRIRHASSFGVCGALGAVGGCFLGSLACGCVAGCCMDSLAGGCALGFACAGAAGIVDCCCANSRHDAISTKAEILGKAKVCMHAPSACRKRAGALT